MKIAYSTTVCPGWTLDQAIQTASDLGYLGLEMRSFLEPQQAMMCDPMRMSSSEVRSKFDRAGITPVALATGVRYDKPIFPPVIGHIFVNEEEGVQETKQFVDFAEKASVKYVRVYGFELPRAEPRAWGMRRVGERLQLAAQTARNTDCMLLIENGGSFARASDLLELVNAYPHLNLGVSYNIQAAQQAGECPVEGVHLLKDHLHCVKILDVDDEHHPVLLGEGVLACRQTIAALDEMGFGGWVVYKYPKLWVHEDGKDPREVLKHACDTLYEWMQADEMACDSGCECDAANA
jgi:sugar phosphate isomerase/epimerase